MARATVGFLLSYDILEHAQDCSLAKKMFLNLRKVFQEFGLLDKMRARCPFYTVEIKWNKKEKCPITCFLLFDCILKYVCVKINSKETTMAILNGLLVEYKRLIKNLTAIQYERYWLSTVLLNNRILWEAQKKDLQNGNTTKSTFITIPQT